MVKRVKNWSRSHSLRHKAALLAAAALPFLGILPAATAEPIVGNTVILRALDKVTARTSDLSVPIGESVTFGSITILPRYCAKRPPEETPEVTAFLEITEEVVHEVEGEAFRTGVETFAAPAEGNNAGADASDAAPSSTETADSAETADENGVIRLFTGWMFASSPAINALEHPVYDVWVMDCKISAPDSPTGNR